MITCVFQAEKKKKKTKKTQGAANIMSALNTCADFCIFTRAFGVGVKVVSLQSVTLSVLTSSQLLAVTVLAPTQDCSLYYAKSCGNTMQRNIITSLHISKVEFEILLPRF